MTTTTTTNRRRCRRYLLARHGETNYNREGRVQGTSGVSVLTPDGIAQAAALGAGDMPDDIVFNESSSSSSMVVAVARAPPITRTWCSPLSRCLQTYAAIELHEWQGRLRHEIEMSPLEIDLANWQAFRNDPTPLRLDGGKFASVLDCWERAVRNWKVIQSDAATSSDVAANADAHASSSSSNAVPIPSSMETDGVDPSGVVFVMCHSGNALREYEFGNCDCVEVEWHDDDDVATRWRRVNPGGGGEWRYIPPQR
ncbi:hypothetical protein ACHAXA_000322 [Cyclostephanos tholiformis]|uniref:Uncharacterized protein n=1 Tax=Cyclostephanos tholiformis TaxID=382380 RepID=A0ABD3R7I2_9STRA